MKFFVRPSEEDGEPAERMREFASLCPRLFARGLKLAERPDVLAPLLDLTEAVIRNDTWLHGSGRRDETFRIAEASDDLRHRVYLGILRRIAGDEHAAFYFRHYFVPILRQDFDWLIDCLDGENDPTLRHHLAESIVHAYDRNDPDQHEAIFDAFLRHPELAEFQRVAQSLFENGLSA